MKKKFACLAMAMIMVLSLAACGGKEEAPPPPALPPPAPPLCWAVPAP